MAFAKTFGVSCGILCPTPGRIWCFLNPVNLDSLGLITLIVLSFLVGEGAIVIKHSNNSLTPNLFNADPKNTGCSLPSKYSS